MNRCCISLYKNLILLSVCIAVLIFAAVSARAAEQGESRVVRVGYFSDDNFHAGQSDEAVKSGYAYEYYQMISNYTSWKYSYVYGSWSDIYDRLLDGEVDIVADISMTPERKSKMLFSSLPMGEENYYVYVPINNSNAGIGDRYFLNGKKIGVNRNSLNETILEEYVETNQIECSIVQCEGINEMLELLGAGELDAMVSIDAVGVNRVRPILTIGKSDYYFAINPACYDILDELNDAMMRIVTQNPDYNENLREKYFDNSAVRTVLNPEEKKWLADNPVIRLGYERDHNPMSDYDADRDTATGLVKDLAYEFKRRLGVRVDLIAYDTGDMLEKALSEGEIDCYFPVMEDAWLSEQHSYKQTSAVTEERFCFIYHGDYRGMSSYKSYGCVEGDLMQYLSLKKSGVAKEIITYPTLQDCLKAISRGECDATVMSNSGWNYYIRRYSVDPGFGSLLMDGSVGYSLAVSDCNTILYTILETAIAGLDKDVIAESINKNIQVPADYSAGNFVRHNTRLSALILIVVLILVAVTFLRYQRSRLNRKFLTFTSEHDALTGVYNRTAFNRLVEESEKRGGRLCFALVDIDDFKYVNDNFGHETGDRVIKSVAARLSEVVRSEDRVIRYGGDEFVVMLNGLGSDKKHVIADKIARVCDSLSHPGEGLPPVTVSVGAAFSECGYSAALFRNADSALYCRKKDGKNGCTVADEVIKR